jgi:thymidylate synthase (FAD)
MADATVELETSRAIAAQVLRHKSFNFQELSQRYAAIQPDYQATTCRMQDSKNRQSSLPCDDEELSMWWEYVQRTQAERAFANYDLAIQLGIAKEVARMLLPLSTTTKLYMKGNLRSWLHYLNTRLDPSTQLEHRELAQAILTQLSPVYPIIFKAAQAVYPNLTQII